MNPDITISSVDLNRIDILLNRLPSAAHTEALSEELLRAKVVEPWEMPPKVVTMNSQVKFRLLEDGTELCRRLVYPKDLAQAPDTLSVLSPVGSALLGLSEGDRIQWTHPGGRTITVEAIEIVYQPERAGDYDL